MKVRFFRHLHGGDDPEAERVYRWHIYVRSGDRMARGLKTDGWKENIEHWIDAAKTLSESMLSNGFLAQHAIPIDEDGELLNGAHRLACALAYDLPRVYTWQVDKKVWAPPWDKQWFLDNHCKEKDLKRIMRDWSEIGGETSSEGNT